ncbi:N-acetylglucosamine-6-phosphate deacetylase [Thalassotalea maritima]|uniref:N-acetylglucosamine-6-phosphate deacetylase n=1 Tax=Thalassotalea maritima TaxID=3242416 RepID=UPI0035271532
MNNKKFYLYASEVYAPSQILKNHYILVDGDMIISIDSSPTSGIRVVDLTGFSIWPGLLDLHIHGREGADVMDATPDAINTISNSLVKHGVVGFLATTVTATWEQTLKAFENIAYCYENQPSGARVLGGYNEGLFFTKDHKGAHDEKYFLPLNKDNIDALIRASAGSLKVVALAPELESSAECISYLAEHDIKPMIGHTNADYRQTCDALNAGACGGVHVFNGMRGIHHRDPGCAGAVLLDRNAYVEVIADGVHLHHGILDLIYRLKRAEKMGLISDCIVAGGMDDGQYKLGMLDVNVSNGIARTLSGSLAGSTLTLEKAVNNMTTLAGIPKLDAVNMASLQPATFLGIEDSMGSITPGKRACFAIMSREGDVEATIIDGRLVYSSDAISECLKPLCNPN